MSFPCQLLLLTRLFRTAFEFQIDVLRSFCTLRPHSCQSFPDSQGYLWDLNTYTFHVAIDISSLLPLARMSSGFAVVRILSSVSPMHDTIETQSLHCPSFCTSYNLSIYS